MDDDTTNHIARMKSLIEAIKERIGSAEDCRQLKALFAKNPLGTPEFRALHTEMTMWKLLELELQGVIHGDYEGFSFDASIDIELFLRDNGYCVDKYSEGRPLISLGK